MNLNHISGLLVPNLTVELYFLTQLLTIRGGDPDMVGSVDGEENYFVSVHNVVYFAVTVISQQLDVLSLLDKGTLRLLTDNVRIGDFNPALKDQLTAVMQDIAGKVKKFCKHPSNKLLLIRVIKKDHVHICHSCSSAHTFYVSIFHCTRLIVPVIF